MRGDLLSAARESSVAALAVAVALAAAACGAEPAGSHFTVTDSAGVRMATSPAPAWRDTAGWTVADPPRVSIGVVRGAEEYQLYWVNDALRFADGRIVVGNSGTGELRFYDADGRHLRTVGAQGSGPGEFGESTIRFCRLAGDRILATDGRNDRFHIFTESGELVRTSRYGEPPEGVNVWLWGCFADGSLMMGSSMSSLQGRPGEVIEGELGYLRFGPDGTFRNRLFEYASRPRYVNRAGGVIHHPYIPLTPEPAVASGRSAAYLGLGVDHRIRVYGLDGMLASIIAWDGLERRRTEGIWDRFVEASLEDISSDETRRRYRRLYSQDLPLPERVPAHGERMLEDGAGNLWVERYRLPWEEERRWDVFDPDGRWLGSVRTPDRVRDRWSMESGRRSGGGGDGAGLGAALVLALTAALAAPAPAQDTPAVGDTAVAADTARQVSAEHWPRVTGRLTDATTGGPIAGATLRYRELGASAVSDSAGRFVLPRVPPGTHELEIRHVAYGTRTVDVTVRADVTTRLQLELQPEAVEVEPLEVEVEFRPEYLQEEGFYERMERGWGNHLDPEGADRLFGPIASFEGRATLLKVLNTEFAISSTVMVRRRSCARPSGWAVFVDRRPEQFFAVLGQLRGEEVGAVEVYPHGHGAPAWAMTPGCGVLVIWTERW